MTDSPPIIDSLAAHCDFLNVTVPIDQTGQIDEDILDACGPAGIWKKPGDKDGLWRIGAAGGSLILQPRGRVLICGISGTAIEALRQRDQCWLDVLIALAGYPHRVTRLDAAFDIEAHAPPIIWTLFLRGKRAGLRLGRTASKVHLGHWGPGSTGEDTGTLYIGTRTSELRAKVYDKRQQQIDVAKIDPGPRTRYEITVTDAHEVSLADAQDPTALFWHFSRPALLRLPPTLPPPPAWVPAGQGFACPPLPKRTPEERLQRYLDHSDAIATLCKLAQDCGPYGGRLAVTRLQTALNVGGEGGPPPSQAAPAAAGNRQGNLRPTYAEFRRAREANGW